MAELKIRCSSISKIMTNPKSKKAREAGELSKTTLNYMAELEVEERTGRSKEVYTMAMEKGVEQEEQAITLLSKIDQKFYVKNEEHFENQYITGTPDIINDRVIDTKCSWDIHTFPHRFNYTLDKDYEWQLQGYMALTGLDLAELAYCLVNTPDNLIEAQKNRLTWKPVLGDADAYNEAVRQIEFNSLYEDLPDNERVFRILVKRDEKMINQIYERVKQCRKFWEENV